jgi:WD40 repeat protein
MRSDGEVCAIDLNTGSLQSLWKFNPNGIKSRGSIGVSQNGKLIALNYVNQSGAAAVEICNLENGERIGGVQPQGAIFYNYKSIATLSDAVCLFRGEFGKDRERRLEVWDWREGKHLWELSGVTFAEFDADQKSVLLIANDEIQRREALSGTVVSTGPRVGATHSNYPWNIAVHSDWSVLFIPFGNNKMRKLNPWKNEMYSEITPSYGNFASTLMGDFLATVGRVSPTTGVLEIRLSFDGSGTRTFPFLAPVLTEDRAPKIRAKANALAIRFPNVLKIWRLEQAKPSVFETGTGRNARLGSTSYSVSLRGQSGARTAVRLTDSAVKDPKKQTVWEQILPHTLYYGLVTPDGQHILLGYGSQIGAFRVGKTGLEEIWPFKNVWHIGDVWAVHPADRRIWTGKAVLEFSSGRQLVEVKDRRGFVTADSNVWVGSDRVAEIAYLEAAGSDEGDTAGGAVQLALWNAESGELAKSIKAANATWICVSPDALHLAEAGADKRLRIRNAQTLEVEQEFRCHEAALTGVAWHPTLPLLVTQARDGMIRVWNLKTFEKVEEFTSKPHGASRHEDKYMDRLEITADGRELNVYRSGNKFFVFRPECFQGQK